MSKEFERGDKRPKTTGGMSGAEDLRTVETRTPRRKRGNAQVGGGRRGRWKLRDGAQSPDAWGLGMHHSKIETRGTCIPVISHLSPELRPTKREAGWVIWPMRTVLCQKYVPFRPAIGWVITPVWWSNKLGQAHFRGTRHSVDRMERGHLRRCEKERGRGHHFIRVYVEGPATVLGLARTSLAVSALKVLLH